MKKLLSLWLLFFSVDAVSMHRLAQQTKRGAPKNMHLCLNAPRNFGTTHFIAGYKSPLVVSVDTPKKKKFIVDEREPIIAGSSVHLIDEARLTQSFCSTKHNISSVVLSLLAKAKKKIKIAAFSLTDVRIANQLIDAHKNGIDVCIIMDASNMKQSHSKAQKLIDSGISVWRYDPLLRPNHKKKNYEQLMHLKWLIVDDVLIKGSANFTRSAQDGENIESITIFRCPQEVGEHRQILKALKTYCRECIKDITI